jgi:predicted DNA-binding WGR domain protein
MGRGQSGKKKVYEVVVDENVLICSWGMAEKTQRQMSRRVFSSQQAAISAAYEKVWTKQAKGYAVAYAV